jgi:hypothetical protein
MQRTPRAALAAAPLGVLLMTAGAMDAPWQAVLNRDASVPADAAYSGTWLAVRLTLAGLGAILVLAAAGALWVARDEVGE